MPSLADLRNLGGPGFDTQCLATPRYCETKNHDCETKNTMAYN